MDDYNYRPEKDLVDAPESLSSAILKIILEQMEKSICKIKCNNGGNATGFFCIIPHPDKFTRLPVLMTNYHVINEKEKKIIFTLNNEKSEYEIIIDNTRKVYYSRKYDITVIEIKVSDKLEMNSFLELDDNIFKDNPNDTYMKNSIYLIGYPNGGISKYSMGIFKLIEEDNFTIRHLCRTNPGSSGCPIINLNNNKVIGIHKGAPVKNNWNLGTFIKEPIEEFNKTNLLKSNNTIDVKDNVYNIDIEDKLAFEYNGRVKNFIGDEKIFFSDKIIKVNSGIFFGKKEVFLLITNIAVYYGKYGQEKGLKFRILGEFLKGITISKNSNQFILHCNENAYDLLFIYEDRKKLIKIFQYLFEAITGKDLLFCEKNEKDLSEFVAWRKERRKNPFLFKIESSELSSIKDYLNEKPPKKTGKGGGGGGFAAKMAALQKRMDNH